MTRWLWYIGWLIGWFVVPFTFFFVPVANQFTGFMRGLILSLGAAVLYYGFRYINRKLKSREADSIIVIDDDGMNAPTGMSGREAAFVAAAREHTQQTWTPTNDNLRGVHADRTPPPAPDVDRKPFPAEPAGLMKSAGNPLVRRAFAQAMKEVETRTYDSGLWAMALVECNGDERAARLAYMC